MVAPGDQVIQRHSFRCSMVRSELQVPLAIQLEWFRQSFNFEPDIFSVPGFHHVITGLPHFCLESAPLVSDELNRWNRGRQAGLWHCLHQMPDLRLFQGLINLLKLTQASPERGHSSPVCNTHAGMNSEVAPETFVHETSIQIKARLAVAIYYSYMR